MRREKKKPMPGLSFDVDATDECVIARGLGGKPDRLLDRRHCAGCAVEGKKGQRGKVVRFGIVGIETDGGFRFV